MRSPICPKLDKQPSKVASRFTFGLGPKVISCLALFFCGNARGAEELSVEKLPTTELPAGPLTLHQCVDFGLRENTSIKVARARIEESAGSVISAQAGMFPQVGSGGLYQRRETQYATSNGTNPNRTPEDWNINVRVVQNVFSSGGVRARVAAARLRDRAIFYDYLTSLDNAILDIRRAYFAVLLARERVAVATTSVDLAGQQLSEQRKMAEAGTVGEINILRAEVSLANTQPELIRAEAQVKEALVELARVMGLKLPDEEASAVFDVQGSLNFSPPNYDLSSALARADILRPEIQSTIKNIEALHRLLTVEKSATRPRVDVFASYEALNDTNRLSQNDVINGATIGVVGTWQIFDGFNTQGRVQSTEAEIQSLLAQLEGQRLTVESEVRNAFVDLDSARKILANQSKAVELARQSFKAVEVGMSEGINSQLDTLQSRDELVRAEFVMAQARHDLAVAAARLDRAIGHEILVSGVKGPEQLPGMEGLYP